MPRDYPEYEDESPEETYRDPLKPFLIALVVLLLLFAAIIVLLYMRLQTANTRAETLSQELTAVQVQLDDLRAQRAADADQRVAAHADDVFIRRVRAKLEDGRARADRSAHPHPGADAGAHRYAGADTGTDSHARSAPARHDYRRDARLRLPSGG